MPELNAISITIYELTALIFSALSLLLSLYVYVKNRLYSKTSVEFEISNLTRKALSDLQEAQYNFIGFSQIDDDPQMLEYAKIAYKEAIKSLFSAYNEACYRFFKETIDQEYFKENYSSEITNLSTNEEYLAIAKLEQYPSLCRFITEEL